ncbi:MAG: hypothetical protein D6713_02930 [Deltaproteobacteria bacterium]|nr:MAG: hypothetical protein D6713_02930 [Deltaproteobacteria bacterium]
MPFEARGKMLALEISGRMIKGIEYVPGTSPLKVTNFFSTDRPSGEPKEVARFLREFLQSEGIVAKKARVVFTGAACEHRVMVLPKASREEREALVLRKLEEETRVPLSEIAASHAVLGVTSERGVEKQEVLVVSTPLFEVKRLVFTLIEAGITPVQVVSFPVAVSFLHPPEEKDDFLAFVSLTREKSHVVISYDGAPRFSREIFIDIVREPSAGGLEDYGVVGEVEEGEVNIVDDRVATELTRSFLYFKQISRGASVKKVCILGEYAPSSLMERVNSRLVVETVRADSLMKGGYDLIERAGEKAASFDALPFLHLIALSRREVTRDSVNLLPPEYLERRQKVLDTAVATLVVAVFLAVNVVLLGGIFTARSHYRGVIEEVESQLPHLYQQREYASRLKNLREMARESEKILGDLKQSFVHWEEFLGLLAASVPREVTFDEMRVEDAKGYFTVTVKGFAIGRSPEAAQSAVNRFVEKVKSIPFVAEASYRPEKIYPSERYRRRYEEVFTLNLSLVREVTP